MYNFTRPGAVELSATGRLAVDAAGVSPHLIGMLKDKCRNMGIDCHTAPYEADALLAWLSIRGLVDFTLSVDGDIIAYGSKRAIFSADLYTGEAHLFDSELAEQSTSSTPLSKAFRKFGKAAFHLFACLVGCDYQSGGVPGIGDATAVMVLSQLKNPKATSGRLYGTYPPLDKIVTALISPSTKWSHRSQFLSDSAVRLQVTNSILKVLTIYHFQVIYDIATESLRPLCSTGDDLTHDPALPDDPLLHGIAGTTVRVPNTVSVRALHVDGDHGAPDPFDLPHAKAHYLGYFTIDSTGARVPHALPPVLGTAPMQLQAGSIFLDSLTSSMIPGAIINPDAVAESAMHAASLSVTREQCILFLECRNYHGLSQLSVRDLATAVRVQLQIEARNEAQGIPTPLRDKRGTSLHQFLLQRNMLALSDFPQYNELYTATNSAEWISDILSIQRTAPYLSRKLMDDFLQPAAVSEEGASNTRLPGRILQRGYAHIVGCKHLNRFQYCPRPIEQSDVCAFQFICAQSMRAAHYRVTIYMRVGAAAASPAAHAPTLKPITSILRVLCEPQNRHATDADEICAQSGFGHGVFTNVCSHVSALLHVIFHLKRHDGNAVLESPTATLCAWNQPTEGDMYDASLPVAMLPFQKVAYARDHGVAPAPYAPAPSNRTSESRSMYNPFDHLPLKRRALLNNSTEARKMARKTFYESLAKYMNSTDGPCDELEQEPDEPQSTDEPRPHDEQTQPE